MTLLSSDRPDLPGKRGLRTGLYGSRSNCVLGVGTVCFEHRLEQIRAGARSVRGPGAIYTKLTTISE
jgi:hypothetical protein